MTERSPSTLIPACRLWRKTSPAGRPYLVGRLGGLDAWQRRPPAERSAIIEAREAAEPDEAKVAHALLDTETRELTGQGFDELLANGRPFDPDELRYLDAPFEYLDGSGADAAA